MFISQLPCFLILGFEKKGQIGETIIRTLLCFPSLFHFPSALLRFSPETTSDRQCSPLVYHSETPFAFLSYTFVLTPASGEYMPCSLIKSQATNVVIPSGNSILTKKEKVALQKIPDGWIFFF